MILKNKDIPLPTEEQIAEMKAYSSTDDPGLFAVAINSETREAIMLYTASDETKSLIYILTAEDVEQNIVALEYYYFFENDESSETDSSTTKGCWLYCPNSAEFGDRFEQLSSICFNESGAEVYSESYFSLLAKTIEENQIFLNTQKEIVLKTQDKCCSKDIKISPLLQKKVVTSRGIVVPDEGFSGLDGVLVDVPDGVVPTGKITLTQNKTTYNVREYEEAYVDVDPEDLNLSGLEVYGNGVSIADQDAASINGYYYVYVNVSGNNIPILQEKTIDTNGEYYPEGSYSGLSKVKVDVHATLIDKEITENGVYSATNSNGYNEVTVDVPEPYAGNGKYLVRCVDYDGRILKHRYLNTGDEFIIPDISDHDGRLNHAELPQTITVENQDITISPIYYPTSGYSEFDITIDKNTEKTITFQNLTFSGDIIIDWGDGTAYDGTLSHTYTDYGDYTIKIKNIHTIGEFVFGQYISGSGSIFKYTNPEYTFKRVFLAETVTTIAENAFRFCYGLVSITIPNTVTTIGNNAFYGCYSLTSIAIPESITKLGTQVFSNCRSLFSISLPSTLTAIGMNCFASCYALNSINLHNNCASIGFGCYDSCWSLRRILVPNGVVSLGSSVFSFIRNMQEYDFSTHTSVPTLLNPDCFEGINDLCKIIVPDALYDEWISADHWSTYANYIYKVSEV